MIPASPIRLFHFTALKNLPDIIQSGSLKSKKMLEREHIQPLNIAYNHIQERRAKTFVAQTGLSLHEYVPFMFAPRSPMLYAIINNNVEEAEETDQNEIIYFVTDVETVKAEVNYIFTDHQAVCSYATFYDDLNDLDKIDWKLFFEPPLLGGYCQYFKNDTFKERYCKRRESREAEFLIRDSVPLSLIQNIAVNSEQTKNRVESVLKTGHIELEAFVKPEWYF